MFDAESKPLFQFVQCQREESGGRTDGQATYISNAKAPVKMVVRKTAFLRMRDLEQRNGPVSSLCVVL